MIQRETGTRGEARYEKIKIYFYYGRGAEGRGLGFSTELQEQLNYFCFGERVGAHDCEASVCIDLPRCGAA